MSDTLRDGTGSGKLAKVNNNNRLYVNSISTDENQQATRTGRSYNINSGEVTLTNATATPVIYLKNNENEDLHITAFAIGLGTSANGDATIPVKITVVRNPTGGTIVDNATAVDINSNRNYGSSSTLTVDCYKGATGNTMTGGENHILFFQPDFGRLFATIDEVIPKGSSLGVTIEPPTGNTSLLCYAALICHLEDANE